MDYTGHEPKPLSCEGGAKIMSSGSLSEVNLRSFTVLMSNKNGLYLH
jgi:hypothetical protein